MKEKLIELLLSAEKVADEEGFCNCHKSRPKAELMADYLIQNGVIVPPCKVGDTVYELIPRCTPSIGECPYSGGYGTSRCRTKLCGEHIETTTFRIGMIDRVGKDIFLTKEEAENKLKENNK